MQSARKNVEGSKQLSNIHKKMGEEKKKEKIVHDEPDEVKEVKKSHYSEEPEVQKSKYEDSEEAEKVEPEQTEE